MTLETTERTPMVLDQDFARRHAHALGRVLAVLHAHGFTDDLAPRLDLSALLLAYGQQEREAAWRS